LGGALLNLSLDPSFNLPVTKSVKIQLEMLEKERIYNGRFLYFFTWSYVFTVYFTICWISGLKKGSFLFVIKLKIVMTWKLNFFPRHFLTTALIIFIQLSSYLLLKKKIYFSSQIFFVFQF